MSDCRFGISPVNYPDIDPDPGEERAGLCASRAFVCLLCTR